MISDREKNELVSLFAFLSPKLELVYKELRFCSRDLVNLEDIRKYLLRQLYTLRYLMTAAEPCPEFPLRMSGDSIKEDDRVMQIDELHEQKRIHEVNGDAKTDSEVNVSNADDKSVETSSKMNQEGVDEQGNDRERSSSPEIIHIRTVPAPPSAVKPTEEELKKRFEVAYLDNVLFKIHQLLTHRSENSSGTDLNSQNTSSEEVRNTVSEACTVIPSTKTSDVPETVAMSSSNDASKNLSEEKVPGEENSVASEQAESSTCIESSQDEPSKKKQKMSDTEDSDEDIKAICTINVPPSIPGFTPALESKLCDLWDLSNQKPVAQFMHEKSCFNPLKEIVMKSVGPVKEISCGILANMCTVADVCKCVTEDTDLVEHMTNAIGNPDLSPDIQSQMLKLFSYCLQREEDKWVDFLEQKKVTQKCFEMLRSGKKSTVEKIVDNLMFILDISEGMKTSLCEDDQVVQSVCEAITKYGVNTKEESSIETVSCLLSILSQVEACEEIAQSLFYPHSSVLLDTFETIISSVDQNQLLYFYKQVLARLLNLTKYIYKNVPSMEEKLKILHRYSKSTTLIMEFLDSFEQEAEDLESDVDNFSWHYNYQVLSECYDFCNFVEKVKNEVGEEKFYQGFTEENTEVLKQAFESYAKNEHYNCEDDDDQSDGSDIVEIAPQSLSNDSSQSTGTAVRNSQNENVLKTTSEFSKPDVGEDSNVDVEADDEAIKTENVESKNSEESKNAGAVTKVDTATDSVDVKKEKSLPEDAQTNSLEHTTTTTTTTLDSQSAAKTAETSQEERLESKADEESKSPKDKNEAPENDDGFGSPPPDDLSDTDL